MKALLAELDILMKVSSYAHLKDIDRDTLDSLPRVGIMPSDSAVTSTLSTCAIIIELDNMGTASALQRYVVHKVCIESFKLQARSQSISFCSVGRGC